MATRIWTRTNTKTAPISTFISPAFSHLLTICVLTSLLAAGFANANACGVKILFPQSPLTFYYLDTVNVSYVSKFSNQTLLCWCGKPDGNSPTTKCEVPANPFSNFVLVLLDFSSSDQCWFELRPNTTICSESSPQFTLLPVQRPQGGSKTTIGLLSATASTAAPDQTGPPVGNGGQGGPGELSTGAKAGIALGVILTSIVIIGMAAWFYFKRRNRQEDSVLAGRILDHDRRGRKGREKLPRSGSSAASGRSDEPLQVQPVFDGFPGSTGYDDVRSLGSSTYLHSPTGGHSPTLSANDGYYYSSDRENLTAARLQSASLPTVVSYGPNPVTPNLTPRPSGTRFNEPTRSVSTDGREECYPPAVPSVPSYTRLQAPTKPPAPLVVSYGPNRVTPTPAITMPTILPPDDAVMTRVPDFSGPEFPVMALPSHPFPAHDPFPALDPLPTDDTPSLLEGRIHEAPAHPRRFSFEIQDEPPMSAIAPLPPYASTADFYAMEKGAIRKMTEPMAQAELPPTKDGFYHYGDHSNEYELPGAEPQKEPQLPYQPYRNYPDGRGREVDEQKFLLSDVEISRMRQLKAKNPVRPPAVAESYEMRADPTSSGNQRRNQRQSMSQSQGGERW